MARDKEAPRTGEREVTPSRLPDVTPPPYPSQNYDFILQAVWEINRTLGSLQTSVESLSKQTKEHDDKIDKLSHKVYAATAVIAVLWAIALALLGYFHK
jgi:hypothetical protein